MRRFIEILKVLNNNEPIPLGNISLVTFVNNINSQLPEQQRINLNDLNGIFIEITKKKKKLKEEPEQQENPFCTAWFNRLIWKYWKYFALIEDEKTIDYVLFFWDILNKYSNLYDEYSQKNELQKLLKDPKIFEDIQESDTTGNTYTESMPNPLPNEDPSPDDRVGTSSNNKVTSTSGRINKIYYITKNYSDVLNQMLLEFKEFFSFRDLD